MPQTSTFESCRVIPSLKKSTLFYFGMSTGISFFGTGSTECIAPENRGKPGTKTGKLGDENWKTGKTGENWGKTGDRRDVPQHPHGRYSSKLNSLCRSLIAFDGRPPFCGAKVLSVVFSKSRTNSSVPNGRPVCVLCRTERISDSVSPASRYSFQLETSHRSLHGSMVSNPFGAVAPQ